jgi:hypothetical protein
MRFLGTFLAWLGVLIGVLLVAITIVNPRREFFGTAFPALNPNSRKVKTDFFDAELEKSPPVGIIIGSSRSMKLTPKLFSSITGESFFNFAVFSASIEDDLAIARYVLSTDGKVRDLVIGVDPESFDSQVAPLAELGYNARLAGALRGVPATRWDKVRTVAREYRDALTFAYVVDVARSVLNSVHPPEAINKFLPDGVVEYPKFDRERAAGRYPFSMHYEECADHQRRAFANYDSLGAGKRAMLDSLIAEATARGVRVVLWMPPLNPAFATQMRESPIFRERYGRVTTYLSSLHHPPSVTVVDENDSTSLPNPNGWYDCVHYDRSNANAISIALANAVRTANATTVTSATMR